MNVSVAPYPRFKAFYPGTGTPLSGGSLYTAQAGTNIQYGLPPSYPQPTYTDSTGTVQNPNPITLDGNGECDCWLSGYTKLVLFDANGNLVWSKDNVSSQAQIQASSLQWIPQTTQVTYGSANAGNSQIVSFTVPGNQTANYPPGTAVMATITGANVIGVVQSSSYSGGVTTVTVFWYSTAINTSLSAVYTGIVSGGVPGSTPVMPVQQFSANMTANAAGLFQTWNFNSANNGTFTLPAANSVPSGSYYDVMNVGASNLTAVGTINGGANLTLTSFTGKRIYSDGTNWYAK
jgi:hypothetical protein